MVAPDPTATALDPMPTPLLPAFLLAVAAAACSRAPDLRDDSVPLTTVEHVDIERYTGLWYEIARFPNRFQDDCYASTAEYRRRTDGMIAVTNTCRSGSVDGESRSVDGRARVVDTETNSQLQVSFFGPFWSDYWIIGLAEDYSLALIGEPKGRYLWILAREPVLAAEVRESALSDLRAFGYDVDALRWAEHPID